MKQIPTAPPKAGRTDIVDIEPTPAPSSTRKRENERQFAVALSHDLDAGQAPTVVAKGYGEMAEKILRLAFESDVKVRTDPDLAQILEVVEVDCEIPMEAFAAVAEILTYVYRVNGEAKSLDFNKDEETDKGLQSS